MISGRLVTALLLIYAVAVCAAGSNNDTQAFNVNIVAPAGCTAGECKLSLTIVNMNDSFKFLLDAEDEKYVAVALAGSAMMGNDKVLECVAANRSDSIEVYHSTNEGLHHLGNNRDEKQDIDSVATNITGGLKNGHIFCSFMLKPIVAFPNVTLDLTKSSFYLQIASGKKMKKNNTGIAHHDKWATTLRAVSLTKDEGTLKIADNIIKSSGLKLTSSVWLLIVMLIAKARQ